MIAKKVYYVCVKLKVMMLVRTEPKLKVSRATTIIPTLSNLVMSNRKKNSL